MGVLLGAGLFSRCRLGVRLVGCWYGDGTDWAVFSFPFPFLSFGVGSSSGLDGSRRWVRGLNVLFAFTMYCIYGVFCIFPFGLCVFVCSYYLLDLVYSVWVIVAG